jgi:tRNA modification GTPase
MGAKETIVALSSANGRSAIAVIRLSGPATFSIVEACLVPQNTFGMQPARTVGLFVFVNPQNKQEIDHVSAIKYRGPLSFTGEDMVELFCHGGEIVVEKIVTALVDRGAVYGERGEFTRRAYCNGKFDLVKAEAILGLVNSRSEREHASSVGAYFGGYRKSLETWKNAIKGFLRDLEANIEFPDEDDVLRKEKQGDYGKIVDIIKEIEKDINNRQKTKVIEKGINVPIVGIPNAGKSSLFNLLLECDRSIVHWEAGTTRDSISEEVEIGSERIRLVDTAGLRKTKKHVERLGIKKTDEHIRNSALILWVSPADRLISSFEKTMVLSVAKDRTVCIISKEDQGAGAEKKAFCKEENIPVISSCLLDSKQRGKLVSFIKDQIDEKIGTLEMPRLIHNKRQEMVARRLLKNLKDALAVRKSGEEVFAHLLQKALEEISLFVGETTSDEILNSIFSEFCIGK